MKTFFLLLAMLFNSLINPIISQNSTRVIAHRGFWTKTETSENSIQALRNSSQANVYGSEFDVVVSKDGIAVVYHDYKLKGDGRDIRETNYKDFKDFKLENGERIPTLEQYLEEGAKYPNLKLILELKPLRKEQIEDEAVKNIICLVEKYGVKEQTEYISFSLHACEVFASQTDSLVSFLSATNNVSLRSLKEKGIDGIDYHYKVYYRNKNLIHQAKELGMITNTWTVNSPEDAKILVEAGIDFITSDYPEKVFN